MNIATCQRAVVYLESIFVVILDTISYFAKIAVPIRCTAHESWLKLEYKRKLTIVRLLIIALVQS